ncbi:MAG: hypothetical protein P8Y24_10470 [Gammaproteobacteria bacterium]
MNKEFRFYLVSLFILGCLGMPVKASAACPGFLPADATPVRNLYLCKSGHNGLENEYACHDFTSRSGEYRVLFKGGVNPIAIIRIDTDGNVKQYIWRVDHETGQPVCMLPVNRQVPENSEFNGAGVCQDENNRSVPCTVFRYKGPRRQTFTDYVSLYGVGGNGVQQTDPVYTGYNKDAMPAELAYQIGLSLLNTTCCKKQGLEYIEQAYLLFPASQLYSQAYQQFKSEFLVTGDINIIEENF